MHRALAISLLGVGPTLFCSSALAQDDASFRSDPAHTGVYDSPGTAAFHKIKWQFPTRGQILSSPVIATNTVYFGSNDHHLHALDLATGTEKWKFKTGGRIPSTPAVANGVVFFLSYDSNFYAVYAATGALKWKFATGGERRFAAKHLHGSEPATEMMPDPFDFFLSSPVVSDGVVYFGSSDTNVYALDAATGAVKWKFKTAEVVHSSPALANGTLFVGSWDTYLYALDAASGKEKWRFKTGEDHETYNQVGIQGSPAIANGMVYFGCRDSTFYALDVNTGKQIWSFNNKGSWVINSPAVRDGKVYFATSDTGLVHALDAKTGAAAFNLDFNHWPMFSSPAIAGHMLYLGSHRWRLMAMVLSTEKAAWSFETEA
jgi:outer membrane protein assembly factor BamB